MEASSNENQPSRDVQFLLHPHRSLTPNGFLILMLAIGGVSFVMGVAFMLIGAWPVFGFLGLDVVLIYLAFKWNFRAARLVERIDLSPEHFRLTRHFPNGRVQEFACNPYWARVLLSEDRPDGRTSLRIAAQGRNFRFGEFLTDDERRQLVTELNAALSDARRPFPC